VLLLLSACSHTDAPIWSTGSTGDTASPGGPGTPDTDPTSSATPVEPGDLAITEIMPDPLAVDGDYGEYFELTSLATRDLDLEGLTVEDDDGTGFVVTGSLPLPVGGRLVFGPSDNLVLNGGVPVDYAYDVGAVKLGNEGDTVAVLRGSIPIDVVAYEAVSWGVAEGSALSLDPSAIDPVANDDLGHWCLATSTYGAGDHGTPGAPNDACP
jgi:hypothetical protein